MFSKIILLWRQLFSSEDHSTRKERKQIRRLKKANDSSTNLIKLDDTVLLLLYRQLKVLEKRYFLKLIDEKEFQTTKNKIMVYFERFSTDIIDATPPKIIDSTEDLLPNFSTDQSDFLVYLLKNNKWQEALEISKYYSLNGLLIHQQYVGLYKKRGLGLITLKEYYLRLNRILYSFMCMLLTEKEIVTHRLSIQQQQELAPLLEKGKWNQLIKKVINWDNAFILLSNQFEIIEKDFGTGLILSEDYKFYNNQLVLKLRQTLEAI